MARFNALRGALEEDPFLGGGPMGIGSEVEAEAPTVDHGDTTLARAEGLRLRGRVPVAWRERSTESPIPVASAPLTRDAVAPTASALPTVTSEQPAGKPESMGAPNLPAPSSEGAGGDDEMSSLRKQLGLQQMFEALGSAGSGKNLYTDGGVILDRMKQVQALRAKREERAADVAQEQAQYEGANMATLTTQLAAFKERPEIVAALQNLKPGAKYTKPSDFIKSVYQAVTNPPTVAKKEADVPLTEARRDVAAATAEATPKKVDIAAAAQAERELEGRRRDAREWARIRAGSRQAATRLTEGKPDPFRKEVDAKVQTLGTAVSKEYGEIASALKEADRSLIAVRGVSPDLFAKVAQATSLDGLNTPQERALFRSIGELRRAAQKAQSGLAVTEPERQEFLTAFGQNWMQNPSTLLEAIEWMRRKTRDKLDILLATYRGQGDVGNTAIQAYEQGGGITPNAEYLKPFSERTPKTASTGAKAASAAQSGGAPAAGTVTIKRKSDGKTKTVPAADKAKWLANPDFEEVK